ncbi:NTP transferase domain-containing protein [Aquibacillus koreensis]|nr:NTP transferase domain-containing protein [Aquibacillus koreensis]MCT2537793.1 NTP transferase domain-containing protein [Aquibacillus koreensis]
MKQADCIGIYLAAGKSTRMGKDKLSLPFKNGVLGNSALEVAKKSKIDHIAAITKEKEKQHWLKEQQIIDRKISILACKDADKGQANSIKCGVKFAKALKAKAVVILLADQPLINENLVNQLIDTYHDLMNTGKEVHYVASSFKGVVQPPILFKDTCFPELLQLEGDKGARSLIRMKDDDRGVIIECDDWRCFYDVDTEEDYRWIMGI